MSCAHATLKRLNGGVCPRCDEGARAEAAEALRLERREELLFLARKQLAEADKARRIMATRHLAHYVRLMWPVVDPDTPLEWNWHHDVWCRHIQYSLDEWRVRKRHQHLPSVMQNLLGNIPPGTAKSRILSVMAPSWMWIDSPSWRVTCVSSNDAVVARDHEMMGKIVRSPEWREAFQPKWTIETDNAKTGIVNTSGGARLSRTFLSGAVGLRGDALFFDDIDDPARVKSAAYRAERDLKWSNAWFNRVNDDRIAVRIVQQQRVDPQDHTSTLIGDGLADDDGKLDWAQVVLPLHWRPGLPETPIGTGDPRSVEGEILHPARFPPRVIRLLRRALGEAGFDQQYDQRSSPAEAKMFPERWWRFFQRSGEVIGNGAPRYAGALGRPERCGVQDALVLGSRSVLRRGVPALIDDLDEVVISVDASFATEVKKADDKSNDGLGVIGKRGTQAFVLKDATKRRTYPELKRAVKQLMVEWPEASKLLIEEKANGAALIGELRTDPELRDIKIVAIKPTESKKARATANQPAIEDGAVFLLDGADWLHAVVDEHAKYEGRDGDKSDRVDWISQALRHWAEDGVGPWWMTQDEQSELGGLL